MTGEGRAQVLVIDDEEPIRNSLQAFLEDFDYRVITAKNGREGIDLFDAEHPDLVLVDLRMPVVDGLDVLAYVTRTAPDTPIIVVSGTGVIKDVIEALRLGAWDYLLKPVEDLSVLRHAIEKTLERSHLLRENQEYQLHLEDEIAKQTEELKRANAELKREVTTRAQAEERLRRSQEMLGSILRAIPDVIYRLDSMGRIVFISEAVRRYGYEPEDLCGRNVLDLVHPDDRERVRYGMHERRTGSRRTKNLEVRLFVKRGSGASEDGKSEGSTEEERVFLVEAEGVFESERGGKGMLLGTQGIARDISDYKKAEEALHRRGQALEQSVDGIIITGLDGTMQFVNKAWASMHGYEAKELVGQHWRVFFTEEQLEGEVVQFLEAAGQPGGCKDDISHVRKDGSAFPTRMSTTALRNDADSIVGLVWSARDITDELRLEGQLRQAQKLEAIGHLAGGVAHDFNNLLQGILGYGDMAMQELPSDSPAYESIEEVMKAADRATTLIRQLLTFSRREKLEARHVDLNRIISDLMKMIQRVIGEHIELRIAPGHKLGVVFADPGQLEQILMNLCVNARDAMPQGGQIQIETSVARLDRRFCQRHPWARPGEYVLLSVTDNGEGMSPEVRERIFEPFFTTKEAGKGTGLGLATVYGIVTQSGGLIQVESESGKGTCFRIYMPRTGEETSVAAELERLESTAQGTETILLAEDEELVRSLAVNVLERAGYRVLTASDGEEAIRIYEEHGDEVDLLLLDVVMPRKGGRTVYETIRAQNPNVPTLFCSGHSYDILEKGSLPDGEVRLLQKPYNSRVLLQMIRELLDGHS